MSDPLGEAGLIWREGWAFARSCALAAAVEVKLFAAFADGPADAETLAARTGCSPRGIDALAGALVGTGLLTRDTDGRFDVAPAARRWLGPDPETDMGPMILHSKNLIGRWLNLADSVRTGRPAPRDPQAGAGMMGQLVRQLFNTNFASSRAFCAMLADREGIRPAAMLDIGAGAGPWSIPFAQANPDCRVTVIDFPEILPVTQEFTGRHNVGGQYSYRGEDAEAADLGVEQFDLVMVGHVYHSMGPAASADFAARAARALRPGGVLAVAEFVVANDRTGPPVPLLFACNMLLGTEAGTTFTGDEIDGFARDAGLTPLVPIEIPAGSPIRLARKL